MKNAGSMRQTGNQSTKLIFEKITHDKVRDTK
jgi:hypothetical protein